METHNYTQLQAAVYVGMTLSHFNQTLSGKSAASVFQMEKVAMAIDRDLVDLLIEGRLLLEGKEVSGTNKDDDNADFLTGLSSDGKKTLLKVKNIIQAGGEDAKLLKQFIKRL